MNLYSESYLLKKLILYLYITNYNYQKYYIMSDNTINNSDNSSQQVEGVKTFTKQISEDEYKRQGEESTKKALEELNKVMLENKHSPKQYKFKFGGSQKKKGNNESEELSSDNSDFSENSDNSELESNGKDNLLISNAKILQKQLNSGVDTRKRRRSDFSLSNSNHNSNDLYQIVVAQRELELQKNIKLLCKNKELECDIDKLENEMHYLKLDLSNKTLELEKVKDKLKKEISDNKCKVLNLNNKLNVETNKRIAVDSTNIMCIVILLLSVFYNIKTYTSTF